VTPPRPACARIVVAADGERRRFERALHDGVQQDLIAVAVRLQLARQLSGTDLPAAIDVLDEIRRDVREALASVRELANEIYPSLLEARGLPDAIRGAAAGARVVATVDAAEVGRYPAEVEAAVYFCCRAVLEAVVAHAGADSRVAIRIHETGHALRLEVTDETPGLDVAAGLLAPAGDRIDALGGALIVEPAPGGATRVAATVPLG
jgi:signal transduction histidine kinase